MANRFERLFQLPANQYSKGSPVIIAAGVLSKDTETGNIIAQLKFQSVSEKRIKAVKVSLTTYDISKTEVQGVTDYQYLELNVGNGQEFGSNKAIIMPVSVTRSFAVTSVLVVFNDGSIWESTDSFSTLPSTKSLAVTLESEELEKQYRIATNKSAQYVPLEKETIWQCSCGEWNGAPLCSKCKLAKTTAFAALDKTQLHADMSARLAAEQAQREAEQERQRVERERKEVENRIFAERAAARKKKIKKAAVIAGPILCVCLAIIIVFNVAIIPLIQYNKGISYRDEGRLEEALQLFANLGNYKDSPQQVQETYYSKGELLRSQQDFDGAIDAFLAAIEYSDAKNQIIETYLAKGEHLLNNQDYQGAITAFEKAGAKERLPEIYYIEGEELLNSKNYMEAISKFTSAGNYKDAADKVLETYYARAEALLLEKDYSIAMDSFKQAGSYKDAQQRWNDLYNNWQLPNDNLRKQNASTIDASITRVVGIRVDGAVVSAEDSFWKIDTLARWSDIMSIATGSGHVVGLKSDGSVVSAGTNYHGEIDTADWKDIIVIAAGSEHTVGLKSDGTVIATGDNSNGQCNVSEWKNIVAISASDYHTVGLKSDGTVVATKVLPSGGLNMDYGQSDVDTWKDIVAVSTGTFDTVGLKKDGTVVVAGRIKAYQAEVSKWNNIVDVAAGNEYCVGLKSDGTVVAAGNNGEGQCNVKGWKNIVDIIAHYHCTYGLKSDGTLVYAGPDLDHNTFTTWKDIKKPQ